MTDMKEYYYKPCDKIDAQDVNAYFELGLNPTNLSELQLDNSWGITSVDIAPAVKNSETLTYLKLSPETDPLYLEYDGEDGVPQCIHGDDLSKIISMSKLKDVDQESAPVDGAVYVYDSAVDKFKPFDLQAFVTATTNSIATLTSQMSSSATIITGLNNRIASLESEIVSLKNRMSTAETTLTKPTGIPNNAKLVWGNTNMYADYTNTSLKTSGFYTHNPSTNSANDQLFS